MNVIVSLAVVVALFLVGLVGVCNIRAVVFCISYSVSITVRFTHAVNTDIALRAVSVYQALNTGIVLLITKFASLTRQ